jgi:hypothetical protein
MTPQPWVPKNHCLGSTLRCHIYIEREGFTHRHDAYVYVMYIFKSPRQTADCHAVNIYIHTYIHIYIYYIRRPLLVRGHQAARSFVIVSMLLSISCFKCYSFPRSCIVCSFAAFCRSFQLSAVLFLCCYRAHGSTFPRHLTRCSQPGPSQGSPRNSSIFKPTSQTVANHRE